MNTMIRSPTGVETKAPHPSVSTLFQRWINCQNKSRNEPE